MGAMKIGDTVRILPPFAEAYPGDKIITRTELTEDGVTAYFVDGIDGGFDARFLEVINGS